MAEAMSGLETMPPAACFSATADATETRAAGAALAADAERAAVNAIVGATTPRLAKICRKPFQRAGQTFLGRIFADAERPASFHVALIFKEPDE
jgi:hypothetical protein